MTYNRRAGLGGHLHAHKPTSAARLFLSSFLVLVFIVHIVDALNGDVSLLSLVGTR
jgi:hypothetical protein